MVTKRLLKALKETIFYCAAVHLILLAIYVIMSGDLTYFNLASIFDLKLFYPQMDYASLTVATISALPVIALFVWQYVRTGAKSKQV